MTVLVAYASKYGATKEIAEKIADVLVDAGLKTELHPVEEIRDLAGVEAVILGSAVYIGQWRQEAAEWLKNYQEPLSRLPVWLFSSGPTGEGDPSELMQGFTFPEALKSAADHIQPRAIAFFHGVLDRNKLSIGERAIVRMLKAPVGDFRNWDSITAWAGRIARELSRS